MASRPVSAEKIAHIEALLLEGKLNRDAIARLVGVGNGTVSRYKLGLAERRSSQDVIAVRESGPTPTPETDKNFAEFDWEEWSDWIEEGQDLRKRASCNQTHATIKLGDGTRPVILFQLGDTHIGSWGANYQMLRSITKEILETEGLYVALMGDLVEFAINMRSVAEVMGQVLTPAHQVQFLESWLVKMMPKVAFSLWGNHETDREEKMSGLSSVKNLFRNGAAYFGGIGHPNIHVGEQVYKFAASHKFRGGSMYDATFGAKRYMRMEAHDREIALQGDLHRPGVSLYVEGGEPKLAMTSSTLQLASGYAQRYFSIKTFPVFPCVVLRHDRHEFIPFWNLQAALDYVQSV